jgi:hypothetical protein
MANSAVTGPIGSVTGGFIPSICPPPSAAQANELAKAQPGSAAAAAAAIQASEADAKARVAAIEYLGTVDCARWPEAQKALINGLRQDPNECVRFAAARALNSGCCCDKKVIDALRICVSGESSDGAPAENSLRVKAAAFSALQNCLMRVPEELPPETKPPEPEGGRPQVVPLPPTPERRTQRPAADPHIAAAHNPPRRGPITYDEQLQRKTFSQTVGEARHTLFQVSKSPRPSATVPGGQRSLFGALSRARQDVGAAELRRAREQGLVPPRPDQPVAPNVLDPPQVPPDPGVEPGAFTPASGAVPGLMPPAPAGAGVGAVGTAPATEPVAEGVVGDPGPMSNAEPKPASRSGARRGLIGMLFQPRGD